MFRYFEWLIPAFPALGALLNSLPGTHFSHRARNWIAGCTLLGSLLVLLPILIGQILQPGLAGKPDSLAWLEIWTGSSFLALPWALVIDPAAMLLALTALACEGSILLAVNRSLLDILPHRRALILIDGTAVALLVLLLAGNLVSLFVGWSLAGWGLYALAGAGRRADERADAAQRPHPTPLLLADVSLWLAVGAAIRGAGPVLPIVTPLASGAAAAGVLLLVAALARATQFALQAGAPSVIQMALHVLTVVPAVNLLARLRPLLVQSPLLPSLMVACGALSTFLAAAAAAYRPGHDRAPLWLALAQGGLLLCGLGVGADTAVLAFLPAYALTHLSIALSGPLARQGSNWPRLVGLAALAGLPLLPGLSWHARLFQAAFEAHPAACALLVVAVLLLAAAAGRAAQRPPAWQAPAHRPSHRASAVMSAALVVLGLASLLSPPALSRFLDPDLESIAFRSNWSWYLLSALTAGAGATIGYAVDRRFRRVWVHRLARRFDLAAVAARRPGLRAAAWLAGSVEPWLGRWTFGLLARPWCERTKARGPEGSPAPEQEAPR